MIYYKRVRWLVKRSEKLLQKRTNKKLAKRRKRRLCNNNSHNHKPGYTNPYKPEYTNPLPVVSRNFNSVPLIPDNTKIFSIPEYFCVEHDSKDTLKFFRDMISFIEKDNKPSFIKEIFIDARNVKYVSESALMYLFAIIRDAKSDRFIIQGNHPIDFTSRKLFKRLGFNAILEKADFSQKFFGNNEGLLIRGNCVETSVAESVCKFIQNKAGINTTELYGAIVELMGNTIQHAYLESDKLEKKWQIFVQNTKNYVQLIFLDTGMGIPNTVRKNWAEKVLKLFPGIRTKDSTLLRSALNGQFRTRTGESYRGKGLPQIFKAFSQEYAKSNFICSGKGVYRNLVGGYTGFNDKEQEFYGTLYEVNINKRLIK